MVEKTVAEYRQVISACKELFARKTMDYGTAWRILRLPSITDQIFIKAQRIRSIQEKGTQKVDDSIRDEFIGIVNYCTVALMQTHLPADAKMELPMAELSLLYDHITNETLALLEDKNHDYGEAWREMRLSSINDIILMKLLRIKQIEDHEGRTVASEGVTSGYMDIINYAVFALIRIDEEG